MSPTPQPRNRRAEFALTSVENEIPSSALIVHPMSMFSTVMSPTYSADWQLATFLFQHQEMQRLRKEKQEKEKQLAAAAQPVHHLSLLDCACEENLKSILGFLDGASLCSVRRVSRQFYELGESEQYWYNLCIAEWAISPDQLHKRPESYQALYKFACQSLQQLIREFFQEQCLSSMQTSFRIPRDAALTIARRSFVSY